MNYIEKFVKTYFSEGLSECEFEDVSNRYPLIYGELHQKTSDTLEFWLENPGTPDTYKVFEIDLNRQNRVTNIYPVSNWPQLPWLLQSAAQKLLLQCDGWLSWYIDRPL